MRSTVPKLLFAFVLVAMMISAAHAPGAPVPPPAPAALLWFDPVNTMGIALSRDGQYVAVVTGGELRYYGRGSSTPLWTEVTVEDYRSVAISADGNYVAAAGGSSNNGYVYFWADARSRTGSNNPETWTSVNLGGPIERRCIAISDDGDYVAACGTGPNVFYWTGATGRTGANQQRTWWYELGAHVEAIAITPDGNHVAVVSLDGYVDYWKNAVTLTGYQPPATWSGRELGEDLVDVAISNDGNYVAAAGHVPSTVYYWAGALSRSTATETHTWAGGALVPFWSVDMSSSGDSVIAGAEDGVYFWSGARALTGTPTQTWKHSTTDPAIDVAIDSAGDYMAACTASIKTLYFFDSTGSVKWSYEVDADKLSISSDGATLAVGTPVFDSAFLLSTGFPTHVTPSGPVGGFMEPVNKLAVFAPYLALFGAVAAVVVVWKKREN